MKDNVKKVVKKINNPKSIIPVLARLGIFNQLSDESYLRLMYWACIGKKLNLDNPKTFNEKLQWLKINDRNDAYTKMVDKRTVKEYVGNLIGKEYIIPTLGVWNEFDDIDFDSLPTQFVLKCTHDSGGLIIVKDKFNFDKKSARKKIQKSLSTDFFKWGREWPYKNVERKIIAEQYMEDESGKDLMDYKLMCFNGKVLCSFVCSGRYSKDGLKVTFFDRQWKELPFERHYPKSTTPIKCPINYKTMILLAEKLAKDIPFVRVDFYEIKNKVYFGELTFFPGTGFEEITPEEWDYELGSWINIACINKK